jgi:hypothetical protein
MRVLSRVDEAEVVAAFLRAELESERFGPAIREALARDGVVPALVGAPEVTDEGQNAYRRELLGELRGWGRGKWLFGGFPEEIDWFRAALTPDEVASVLYIDWDWWLTLSGGSRRPADAAARIRSGEAPGSPEWHEPIARRLHSGRPLPELILVRAGPESRLVVLEGHVRLTAFMLFPEALPPELELFLGESEQIVSWPSY